MRFSILIRSMVVLIGFSLEAVPPLLADAPGARTLQAEGGECLLFAMELWKDVFRAKVDGFSLNVMVDGEAKAMQDLTDGSIQMALLARDASQREVRDFTRKWGYPPTRVAVAKDALVWVVHKDNPVKGLRIEEINAIFAPARPMGWPKDILTWGDAGVTVAGWVDKPIVRYVRTMDSSVMGLIAQFFPPSPIRMPVTSVPDAMAMTEALAADPAGICTANLVEVFASIRAIPMIPPGSSEAILPTPDTVASGAYPYSRFLYAYINKDPRKGLEPRLKGFLAFILSPEGQLLVKAAGQAPLSEDIAALNLYKVTDSLNAPWSDLR